MWATISAIFSSGAGGGIVGGIVALLRTAGERHERLELARIDKERDLAEYENLAAQRVHEKKMLEAGALASIRQTETEGEIATEVANQAALSQAQRAEFSSLHTSTWVDNLRASVRPVLAYTFTGVFMWMLVWAFGKYSGLITPTEGKEILAGLFLTLEFAMTSILSFFYVSRRNPKTHL